MPGRARGPRPASSIGPDCRDRANPALALEALSIPAVQQLAASPGDRRDRFPLATKVRVEAPLLAGHGRRRIECGTALDRDASAQAREAAFVHDDLDVAALLRAPEGPLPERVREQDHQRHDEQDGEQERPAERIDQTLRPRPLRRRDQDLMRPHVGVVHGALLAALGCKRGAGLPHRDSLAPRRLPVERADPGVMLGRPTGAPLPTREARRPGARTPIAQIDAIAPLIPAALPTLVMMKGEEAGAERLPVPRRANRGPPRQEDALPGYEECCRGLVV